MGMKNGEQGHNLNFPNDSAELFAEKKIKLSQYIGVTYDVKGGKWRSQRRSKHEKKVICKGYYENEETAAHASDALAKKLIAKGEQYHKLIFTDDDTEEFPKKSMSHCKRKRPSHEDLSHPKDN